MFVSAQMPKETFDMFLEMKESWVKPDFEIYSEVIGLLCKKRQTTKVNSLLNDMKEEQVEHLNNSIFESVIELYASENKDIDALKKFEEMKELGLHDMEEPYNEILSMHLRMENFKTAELLFAEMKNEKTTQPNVRTYNIMMKVYLKLTQFNDVINLFTEMEKEGKKPDIDSYSCLMDAYMNIDQTVIAKLFQEVKRIGLEPNLCIYNLVIFSYLKLHQFEKALLVVQEINQEKIKFNDLSYNMLIEIRDELKEPKEVIEVYEIMRKNQMKPIQTVLLVKALTELDRAEEARLVFDEIQNEGKANEKLYNMMIEMYTRLQRPEQAQEISNLMKERCIFERE